MATNQYSLIYNDHDWDYFSPGWYFLYNRRGKLVYFTSDYDVAKSFLIKYKYHNYTFEIR